MTPCEMKENDISHNQLHSVGMIILKKTTTTRKQHMTVFFNYSWCDWQVWKIIGKNAQFGLLQVIDPLHEWYLNLNNNILYIVSHILMFPDKGYLHECKA